MEILSQIRNQTSLGERLISIERNFAWLPVRIFFGFRLMLSNWLHTCLPQMREHTYSFKRIVLFQAAYHPSTKCLIVDQRAENPLVKRLSRAAVQSEISEAIRITPLRFRLWDR
jgi:hypothetical protein